MVEVFCLFICYSVIIFPTTHLMNVMSSASGPPLTHQRWYWARRDTTFCPASMQFSADCAGLANPAVSELLDREFSPTDSEQDTLFRLQDWRQGRRVKLSSDCHQTCSVGSPLLWHLSYYPFLIKPI